MKKNKLEIILFEFRLNLREMKYRDINLRNIKSKDIMDVKKDIDSYTHPDTILINTDKPIKSTIKIIMDRLLL